MTENKNTTAAETLGINANVTATETGIFCTGIVNTNEAASETETLGAGFVNTNRAAAETETLGAEIIIRT